MNLEPLRSFRQEVHRLLTKAPDATFELMGLKQNQAQIKPKLA